MQLDGRKVAMLVANGFERVEMTEPKKALEQAGAKCFVVSPEKGTVHGWNHFDAGEKFHVDIPLDEAKCEEFDALLLPGGVANPDMLRMQPRAVQFVKDFMRSNKPIGVICHGPWTLVEADCVRGRMITSWPSVKTDLMNAGANWVDREVVVDHNLISSRKPADLPAFCRKIVEEFAKSKVRATA